jgi:hypothetical protein
MQHDTYPNCPCDMVLRIVCRVLHCACMHDGNMHVVSALAGVMLLTGIISFKAPVCGGPSVPCCCRGDGLLLTCASAVGRDMELPWGAA